MEDILPFYLAIGVSYEKFMDSCPVELKPYDAAYRRRMNDQNVMNHLLGQYVGAAIMSTIGNSAWFKGESQEPYEYPAGPYPLFEADRAEQEKRSKQMEIEKFVAAQKAMRANWKLTHRKPDAQPGDS